LRDRGYDVGRVWRLLRLMSIEAAYRVEALNAASWAQEVFVFAARAHHYTAKSRMGSRHNLYPHGEGVLLASSGLFFLTKPECLWFARHSPDSGLDQQNTSPKKPTAAK